MADSKSEQKAQQAQAQADQQATQQLNQPERANQAAERAPALDTDLEEVHKADNDPTSQRAPSFVHALTTEYAGYVNTGRPERADMVEAELKRLGYGTDGIKLADSPSLPQRVAEEENKASSAAARRKKAQERKEFAEVTGRRAPEPVVTVRRPLTATPE